MPRPPDYNVIYNWDADLHSWDEVPQSMEAFLDKVYRPMEDTQVGAHFWCLGEHPARWKSDVVEMVGERYGRRYENAMQYRLAENILQMFERGEDPYEALIARGRELGLAVYGSIRMNDNHLMTPRIEDLATLHHSELTQMRVDHPEWLLGEQTSEWFGTSWNFAVPEVREHRLARTVEICERYDWDGVELDWQRHPFYLPDDHEYRLRYVLTDLQRALRNMANRLAEKRGRPFYVAARVAPNLEMCRRIGYDVATWVEEVLVDILIPAGAADTDPSINLSEFLDLCKGTDVVVYPGFDGHLPDPAVGLEERVTKDKMRTRAIAGGFHEKGAHGIYLYNWYANHDSRRELMTEIGSPDTLRGKDRTYAATYRFVRNEGDWRGAFRKDRIWGEVPVALKRTLTGDGPAVVLDVADDLAADVPERIELRVRLEDWVKGDVVRLMWDGAERGEPDVRYHSVTDTTANPFGAKVADVEKAAWLCYEIDRSEVAQGPHEVKVVLAERHPKLAGDIVITHVELAIMYDG